MVNAGWIWYEGDDHCPEFLGQKWMQVYNPGTIDPKIKINCAGKITLNGNIKNVKFY